MSDQHKMAVRLPVLKELAASTRWKPRSSLLTIDVSIARTAWIAPSIPDFRLAYSWSNQHASVASTSAPLGHTSEYVCHFMIWCQEHII